MTRKTVSSTEAVVQIGRTFFQTSRSKGHTIAQQHVSVSDDIDTPVGAELIGHTLATPGDNTGKKITKGGLPQ